MDASYGMYERMACSPTLLIYKNHPRYAVWEAKAGKAVGEGEGEVAVAEAVAVAGEEAAVVKVYRKLSRTWCSSSRVRSSGLPQGAG